LLLIVLLVLFVLVMGVWGLALAGGIAVSSKAESVLGFVACLILGVVVFLAGFGTPLMRPP
jgi:hypothetical protein